MVLKGCEMDFEDQNTRVLALVEEKPFTFVPLTAVALPDVDDSGEWKFHNTYNVNTYSEPTDGGAYEDKTVNIREYLYGLGKHRYHTLIGLNWDEQRKDEVPTWWGRLTHKGRHNVGVAHGARGQSTRRDKWFRGTFVRECLKYQAARATGSGHIVGVMVGLVSTAVWFFAR
jgi:hypothetical protein